MKKILIGVLIVLLTIMACVTIFKGISIGKIKILSTSEIADENDKLTTEIQKVQKLMFTDYQAKNNELDTNISELLEAKAEYYDLANVSTDSELAKANKQEKYTYEYLWTRIGRYATSEGVLLKLASYAGNTGEEDVKNIHYTVTGNYIAVINFIEDIEDDAKLGFRIENFKMVPSGENVQATFATNNVRIKQEQSTTKVTTSSNVNDAINTTEKQTSTTNTNNTAENS
ncbi:MAG: hypothetical protein IJ777_00710 [Clostridia bacterium]|nr:hypothetical protein [Clostridia bacterium]